GGLNTVSLETGDVQELTTADVDAGERSHRWPTALPGGRSVLFLCQFNKKHYDEGDIRIVHLDGGRVTTVFREGAAPRYTGSGHLLFVRDQTVFAVAMDPEKGTTSGMPVPVLSGVWTSVGEQEADDGTAQYCVSPQGVLIYQTEHAGGLTQIAAADVSTGQVQTLTAPGPIASLYASPDGRSIAYRMGGDLHVLNLESGGSRKLTFGNARIRRGAWSSDSRTLFWQASGDSVRILTQPADGSTPATPLGSHYGFGRPSDVSPDGQWMLITEWPEDRGGDRFTTHLLDLTDPEAVSERLLEESAVGAKFSPDGKWFSYRMDDPAARGIYLRRFPDTG
ncbi:MAG: hypothetical protein HKN12_03195, partial [Gemmatimonadetes bacterium]|nr:hypothetical protein [Gemmatimonadota bacterium]